MKNENIRNLISFWQIAGKKSGRVAIKNGIGLSSIPNSDWPNRIWSSSFLDIEKLSFVKSIMMESEQQLKLTVLNEIDQTLENCFKDYGFELMSTQIGMDLDLSNWKRENENNGVTLKLVKSNQEAEQWSKLFKDSFGYIISADSVTKLKHEVSFYMIYTKRNTAGTAVLYTTGKTAGIHSLGIIPKMRKKGIAEATMQTLLLKAKLKGYTKATLQASEMAVNIYKRLGFKEQFKMLNYQINKK